MKEKLSEEIVKVIRNEIIEGKLAGKEFFSENDIAARFGVSKGPVKEAMHILCNEGYIVSYPRKGYMVDSCTAKELADVRQLRMCIEQLCIKLIIENATDEEIMSLYQALDNEVDQLDPKKTNNAMFHMKMAELAGNKYIMPVLYNLVSICSRESIKKPNARKTHEQIVAALLKRDEKKAAESLEIDIYTN